uniref:Uncharacterized protein n=1 Tax=Talaromyces marneffei PM1 TaxID=1077442 RepID=A0A093VRD0_TALMA
MSIKARLGPLDSPETPDDLTTSYTDLRTSSKQSPVVPILFVSPEFTAWTEPTGPLLPQWATPLFNQIHGGDAPDVVYTIAAVVDKISSNSGGNTTATEGLSLLLADSSCITASIATPTRLKSNTSEEPAFFLSAKNNNSHNSVQYHEIGLRLAQTVFRNGRDRTLLGMRWTRDDSNSYFLDSYHDLSSCSVAAPVREAHCAVNIPFHPVTQRRRVISSMGNIVRQVSKSTTDDGDLSAAIPASSELEKELPRYVSERGIPHQRVAVWALVEPPTASSTHTTQEDIQSSLSKGSKIHRVVSGGGGWGKKQGLLSLDPEATFAAGSRNSREASLDLVFTSSSETEPAFTNDLPDFLEGLCLEENIAQLTQVASPGDYIQFFVTPEDDLKFKVESTPGALRYSFGVDAPEDLKETSSTTLKGMAVIHDHFGAISESAISYSQKDSSQASKLFIFFRLSRWKPSGTFTTSPGTSPGRRMIFRRVKAKRKLIKDSAIKARSRGGKTRKTKLCDSYTKNSLLIDRGGSDLHDDEPSRIFKEGYRPLGFNDPAQFNGATLDEIRKHFRAFRESDTNGNQDVRFRWCLVIDEGALQSFIRHPRWVTVVDPNHRGGSSYNTQYYPGYLRLYLSDLWSLTRIGRALGLDDVCGTMKGTDDV